MEIFVKKKNRHARNGQMIVSRPKLVQIKN